MTDDKQTIVATFTAEPGALEELFAALASREPPPDIEDIEKLWINVSLGYEEATRAASKHALKHVAFLLGEVRRLRRGEQRIGELELEIEAAQERERSDWQYHEMQRTRESLRRANVYAASLEREMEKLTGREPRIAPLVEAQAAGNVDEWRKAEDAKRKAKPDQPRALVGGRSDYYVVHDWRLRHEDDGTIRFETPDDKPIESRVAGVIETVDADGRVGVRRGGAKVERAFVDEASRRKSAYALVEAELREHAVGLYQIESGGVCHDIWASGDGESETLISAVDAARAARV